MHKKDLNYRLGFLYVEAYNSGKCQRGGGHKKFARFFLSSNAQDGRRYNSHSVVLRLPLSGLHLTAQQSGPKPSGGKKNWGLSRLPSFDRPTCRVIEEEARKMALFCRRKLTSRKEQLQAERVSVTTLVAEATTLLLYRLPFDACSRFRGDDDLVLVEGRGCFWHRYDVE